MATRYLRLTGALVFAHVSYEPGAIVSIDDGDTADYFLETGIAEENVKAKEKSSAVPYEPFAEEEKDDAEPAEVSPTDVNFGNTWLNQFDMRIQQSLVRAGVASYDAAVRLGRAGLVAISGIGTKTADKILTPPAEE